MVSAYSRPLCQPEQGMGNRQPAIYLPENGKYNIGCYFNAEKYSRRKVADFYSQFIPHIRKGLGIKIASAASFIEFKEIVKYNSLTHVFISDWEYEMDRRYFDELSKSLRLMIFSNEEEKSSQNGNIYIIKKPVSILKAMTVLDDAYRGEGKADKWQISEKYDNLKVLVVDDDAMNIMVAKGILSMYGINAQSVSNGKDAIDRCNLENYDIIFMDHMMPGMDGTETMKTIRRLRNGFYSNIPIIAFTANAGSGARSMFYEQGFDDFIAKPIESSAMSRILRKFSGGDERL